MPPTGRRDPVFLALALGGRYIPFPWNSRRRRSPSPTPTTPPPKRITVPASKSLTWRKAVALLGVVVLGVVLGEVKIYRRVEVEAEGEAGERPEVLRSTILNYLYPVSN